MEEDVHPSEEVVVVALSAGVETICRVSSLSFGSPALVVFDGVDLGGSRIRLVHNVAEINYALRVMPRLEPNKPRRRMGFHHIGKPPGRA
jgi:hypothetical protein